MPSNVDLRLFVRDVIKNECTLINNYVDNDLNTLLHLAIRYDIIECIIQLISSGKYIYIYIY